MPDAVPLLYKFRRYSRVSTYLPLPMFTQFLDRLAPDMDQSKSDETAGAKAPLPGTTVNGKSPTVLVGVDLNAKIPEGELNGAIQGYFPMPAVL